MPRVLKYESIHRLPDGAVYIGRAMPRYGLRKSKWANPFKLRRNASREERAEVIARYELYLYASGLIGQVHELRGKDSGLLVRAGGALRRRIIAACQCRYPRITERKEKERT